MEIKSGRNNLSITVFVPWDCHNKCPFCTSKELYATLRPDLTKVMAQLTDWNKTSIKEVVFTGGEPTANIDKLTKLVELVPDKDVYINTTLLAKTFDDFLEMVKTHSNIKGVNISRHKESYEDDKEGMKNIATDEQIAELALVISTRINCVLPSSAHCSTLPVCIENILDRWEYAGPEVVFRADYRHVHWDELHSYDTLEFERLFKDYPIINHSYCDVCDTVRTYDFTYHRGLATTSFTRENTLFVNDIIIRPDGAVSYDWDYKTRHIRDVYEHFLGTPKESESDDAVSTLDDLLRRGIIVPDDPSAADEDSHDVKRGTFGSCGGFFGGC